MEIETINRCNGVCEFCPVNANEKQRPFKKMDTELFKKIIDQLAELDYRGDVGLFSNNEPLLDKRMPDFAKYAKMHLPKATVYLYTNGKLLTEELFCEIMKYLDFMQIDLYEKEGESDPDNIKEIRVLTELKEYKHRVRYNRVSPDAIRTSRGGNAPNCRVDSITEELCCLPLLQIVIRPDGKISLCCNDALGQMTLGDLTKESILDVWYGKTRRKIWDKIVNGRQEIPMCRYCNATDRRL